VACSDAETGAQAASTRHKPANVMTEMKDVRKLRGLACRAFMITFLELPKGRTGWLDRAGTMGGVCANGAGQAPFMTHPYYSLATSG
jgi:hypothetical protein